MWRFSRMLRLADGPDEVHKMVLARRELNRWSKRAEAEASGEPLGAAAPAADGLSEQDTGRQREGAACDRPRPRRGDARPDGVGCSHGADVERRVDRAVVQSASSESIGAPASRSTAPSSVGAGLRWFGRRLRREGDHGRIACGGSAGVVPASTPSPGRCPTLAGPSRALPTEVRPRPTDSARSRAPAVERSRSRSDLRVDDGCDAESAIAVNLSRRAPVARTAGDSCGSPRGP